MSCFGDSSGNWHRPPIGGNGTICRVYQLDRKKAYPAIQTIEDCDGSGALNRIV